MHKNNHKVLNEGFGDWLSSLNPFGGSKEDEKEEDTKKGGKKTKPDFLDLDKDGDKKESMKKAAADKKSTAKKK